MMPSQQVLFLAATERLTALLLQANLLKVVASSVSRQVEIHHPLVAFRLVNQRKRASPIHPLHQRQQQQPMLLVPSQYLRHLYQPHPFFGEKAWKIL